MKTFLKITILFIFITILATYVYAEGTTNWTDFSKAKVELVMSSDTNQFKQYDIKISNVTYQEDSHYYLFLTNGQNTKTQYDYKQDLEGAEGPMVTWSGTDSHFINMQIETCIENSGDIYATVVETKDFKETQIVLSNYKVERPALNKLGQRMKSFFQTGKTAIFLYEAHREENRNVNLKIGKVTDNNILLSIKNGEADCLQKLLDYSKTASSIYTGTVPLGQSASITGNLDLTNEEYYYVYMEIDTESGKYYPIEDVSLFQALVSEYVGKELHDYLSDEFKWNIQQGNSGGSTKKSDPTQTPKTVLPNTGIQTVLISILVVTIIVAVFTSIKNKKYKEIK